MKEVTNSSNTRRCVKTRTYTEVQILKKEIILKDIFWGNKNVEKTRKKSSRNYCGNGAIVCFENEMEDERQRVRAKIPTQKVVLQIQ